MLHQIGIGTLGPVFRTYEPTRDRLVAVKVFRLDIVPEQAQALAAALGRAVQGSLFHPSIVEPIDAGVEGTLAYRAEEYVAAESLDVAMRHYAPAPMDKVLPFMTQLAGAIDFARAAGIGHGGLHPRDIFVTPDEARATGFGVVEALEQVGIRAPIRRPYSPPERIAGSAWSTPADVFSLAAITFELLTGKRPAGTGAQIGTLPEGAHAAAVQAVLARAMDDDPERRYVSALAFAGALEAASQGRPLTDAVAQVAVIAGAAPPEALPRKPKPGRKPKAESRDAEAESRVPADTDPLDSLPLVLDTPAVEPIAEAQMDVHEPEPFGLAAVAPALDDLTPPTPGEFEIEADLDPMRQALDDQPAPREPLLFDDAPRETARLENTDELHEEDSRDAAPRRERFVHDFAAEQEAEADMRSPLEEEPPLAPPVARLAETAMFQASEPEVEAIDPVERGRPALLPIALVSLPMLLVGFAAGYFVASRERIVPPQEVVSSATPASAPAQGPAQTYSEQKVTEPAPAPPPSSRQPAAAAPATTAAAAVAPQRGQLIVRSLPSHAGVTVNGTWRGRTPLTLDDLRFGDYSIRVVQPGYAVAREEFTLSARAPSHNFTTRLERVSKSPAAAAAAPAAPPAASAAENPASFAGSLYVDSRPRGAQVTIDGRSVGQTPVSVPDVRIGMHVVRIEMDGKKPVTATPRITAGKLERVTVSLEDR